MKAGSVLGVVIDITRVVAAEVIEYAAKQAVSILLPTSSTPAEERDDLQEVSDDELAAFVFRRNSMMANEHKSRPRPVAEDVPPNEPPVGSFEWRRQQSR